MKHSVESLRLLIIDDDEVDRMAVRRALRQAVPDAEVAEAENRAEGRHRLREERFDCALVDYRLPDGDGLTLLREMVEDGVETPVVVLTGQGDELLAVEALKSGAADYLPKAHLNAERLAACLRGVMESRRSRARDDETRRRARQLIDSLTEREREVLDGLVEGKANKVIAIDLGISCRTVESHRARIMRKMQARSLADLVQVVLTTR